MIAIELCLFQFGFNCLKINIHIAKEATFRQPLSQLSILNRITFSFLLFYHRFFYQLFLLLQEWYYL